VVDWAGFEPAASTMPTWRSYQTDLPALRHTKHKQKTFKHFVSVHEKSKLEKTIRDFLTLSEKDSFNKSARSDSIGEGNVRTITFTFEAITL
jgi:hypothetical protein